jgi:hypothetical protein
MNSDPAVLINAFEVPDGADEAFLQAWESARAFLRTQPGYLSARLLRARRTELCAATAARGRSPRIRIAHARTTHPLGRDSRYTHANTSTVWRLGQ